MFVKRYDSHSISKQKMASFMGRLAGPKMTSPRGKLTAQVCHPTKKVKKGQELTTYFSTNIGPKIDNFKQIIVV